jgi:6-phosphofructokinase
MDALSRNTCTLDVSQLEWQDTEGDRSHLLAILVISGTFHHLEAIRVIEDEDGRQRAASPDLEDTLDALFTIGGDGPFDTVTIRGETYVLVVIPFQ